MIRELTFSRSQGTSSASTHPAVVTTAPRAPLSILEVSTPSPTGNEVLVKNLWTASTPLDLHQADGGLGLTTYPARLGDGVAVSVLISVQIREIFLHWHAFKSLTLGFSTSALLTALLRCVIMSFDCSL